MAEQVTVDTDIKEVVTPPPAADPLQTLAQMTQTADQQAEKEITLPKADVTGIDTSRIPELPVVESTRVGRAMSERLTDEQRALANQVFEKVQLEDTLEIDEFGSQYQENARQIGREAHKFLIENIKSSELGQVGELAQEMKHRFRELGLGEMGFWEKVLRYVPFIKKDKLQAFIDGRQNMADLMAEIREATVQKSVDVELFYHKLEGKIKGVKGAIQQLTIVGAVIEMKITETEKKYRTETERLKKLDKLDDEDLESIHKMKQTLSALDMKLAHVKAMRSMMRQSAENFKMIREGMGVGMTKLKNQIEIQDIVWTTKIDEAIAVRELQKVNAVVQTGREFTDKLVSINVENIDEALKTIFDEAGKPGVSIELLRKSAEAQKVLADSINVAFVENRKKLQQAAAQLDELDERFAERGTDLQTLMKMLEVAKLDAPEQPASTTAN